MKKVLYILGEFDDTDADWLVQAGRKIDVPDGQVPSCPRTNPHETHG